MKFVIISNFFSGLSSIVEEKKFINKGSPYYFNLINYLSKQGYDYNIYFLRTSPSSQKRFIETIYLNEINNDVCIVKGFDFLYKVKFGKTVNKLVQYALVFLSINLLKTGIVPYIDRGNTILSYILCLFKKKHALRVLGADYRFIKNFHSTNILRSFDKKVFSSEYVTKILTKDGSYTELLTEYPNVHLLFNGIDNLNFSKYKNDNIFTIAYVSRVEKDKGQRELLLALKELKSLPIKLNLIGDGNDMPYIRQYVEDNELSNVNLLGKLEHGLVFNYLINSDLFISINHLGMYGNTLLEASKALLPIISLDHDYFEDENKKYFYIIKKETLIEDLENGILSLFKDKALREYYSNSSSQFSSKLNSWKDRIELEINLLKLSCNED